MPELIDIERARELVLAECEPLPAERCELGAAEGRTLAATVSSEESVPGFDNSAMDGYAVRAADLVAAGGGGEPVRLEVVGESRAGTPSQDAVGAGEAIAISTGAMVPAGADAVVRVEDTQRVGDEVLVSVGVPEGNNIRRAGEDIAAGEQVIAAGALIGPAELGVLASVGAAQVDVHRRPRVTVIATGDELRGPGEELGPGQIRNSNSWSVPALARAAGAEVSVETKVPDDLDATVAALDGALSGDLTVICGGVSVGEHDHVKPALERLGVERRFWGVALKPGKPTYFGRAPGGSQGGLVMGLPGNPVSAMVTFTLFARPALLAMTGRSPDARRTTARLADPQEKVAGRAHLARCRLELGPSGWLAHLATDQGSHVLTSMLGADALAVLPAAETRFEAGAEIVVELLD